VPELRLINKIVVTHASDQFAACAFRKRLVNRSSPTSRFGDEISIVHFQRRF
jgi:hypothetical protein